MFSVEVWDQNGNSIQRPTSMTLAAERFTWQALGGADAADLTATGRRETVAGLLGWLNYRVLIRNQYGTAVWWGYVEEALLNLGEYSVGVSLEPMYNRVAVAYTYTDLDNVLQRGTTAFFENATTAARYGKKELLHSYSDLESLADAEELAQTLIDRLGTPVTSVQHGTGDADTATLRCRGYWAKTTWRYYKQQAGREAHESYFGDQVVGVGLTDTNVVFVRDDKIVYAPMGMHGFKGGDKFDVSGSASNNLTRSVATPTRKEIDTYTATTIEFAASDDIWDSAQGFEGLADNDVIQIRGSAANAGIKTIKRVERGVEKVPGSGIYFDHIELTTTVIAEAAGPSITINRFGYIKTVEALNTEPPGATTTLAAWGSKVAQSFSLEFSTAPWPLHEVKLRLRKTGTPGDGVKVALHADNAGLPAATSLDSSALLFGSIGTEYGWEAFPFSGGVNLSYGTTYWLVVERTGANNADNYYEVGVDDNEGYSRGVLKIWGQGAWQARPTAASLAFQVIGKKDTGAQIKDMLVGVTSLFGDAETITTQVLTPTFRDGDTLVSEEIEDLATRGDSAGVRLIAEVTPERVVRITSRPGRGSEVYSLRGNGDMLDQYGQPLPPGVSLAAKWVRLDEPGLADVPAENLIFFVEEADYETETGRWQLRPEHAPSPFDIGIQQG